MVTEISLHIAAAVVTKPVAAVALTIPAAVPAPLPSPVFAVVVVISSPAAVFPAIVPVRASWVRPTQLHTGSKRNTCANQ